VTDKMSKKELKQPDTFQKVGAEARDWMAARQRWLALAVAGVLGVGLLIALVSYFSRRSDERTLGNLGEALAPLVQPVGAAAMTQPGEPSFKSEAEQTAALRNKLVEFQQANSNAGRANQLAAFGLGHAELQLGNPAAALPHFETFLKDASKDDPLAVSALEGKGYALEAKGDLDGALKAFDELAQRNSAEFLKGMGRYHHGRILLAKNQPAEAMGVFLETQTAFPGTQAAQLSEERVNALTAQGVVPKLNANSPPAAAPSSKDGG